VTTKEHAQTKSLILVGAIVGVVLTLVVSFLMDFLYSDALQGTWRDAIVMDMQRYFNMHLEPNSLAVYALFALVFFFLSVMGALIGIVFMFILVRVLHIFTS
jgi:ABC-type antimicrobial peptide transport system permease subunit